MTDDPTSSITSGLDSLSSGVGDIGQNIGAIFGVGSLMRLGAFTFNGFEIPESVKWGGSQQMTVHKLVGGTRIIDSMGRDDTEITWSGTFLSIDATSRAKILDTMRQQGKPLKLSWGSFSLPVVIKEFSVDYKYASMAKYQITCTYLGSPPPTGTPSLLQTILDDIGKVYNSASNLYNTITNTLSTATAAVAKVTTLLGVSGIFGATAPLSGPLASINSVVSRFGGSLTGASGALTPLLAGTPTPPATTAVVSSLAASLPPIGATLGSVTNPLGGLDLNGATSAIANGVRSTVSPILNGTSSLVGGTASASALLAPIAALSVAATGLVSLASLNITIFVANMTASVPSPAILAASLVNVQQSVNGMALIFPMTGSLNRAASNLANPAAS